MIEQYNADDPEQVERAKKKSEIKDFARSEEIRKLMSTKDGRELMNSWLTFLDMFGNPYVAGDVYGTHINIGMANAGKFIWSQLEEVVPEQCILMRKEAREDEKEELTNPS